MPLIHKTLINWWNSKFKTEVIAIDSWFSSVAVKNLNINGVAAGSVLLLVMVFLLSAVNFWPSITSDVPADGIDETDLCI